MRKQKKGLIIATFASMAALGAGLAIGGGSVSAADHEYIYFKTRVEGTQQPEICAFYDSVEAYYDACESSYGSYDTTSQTLTLGAGINNLPNGHIDLNMNGVTISASSDIKTAIYASSTEGLVLDFGSHSFTDTAYKMSSSSDEHWSDLGNGLTIKSGIIDIASINVFGPLSIEGGTINIVHEPIIAITARDSLSISGGIINIPKTSMVVSTTNADLNISGGVINAEDIKTAGFSVSGNVNISGGEINLKSNSTPAGFGISLRDGKNFTISGGDLTIDGFSWGISGINSKASFNGGTTVIKNSKNHTIWIEPAADPENDISFGEGMGIKENTYVFYGDVSEGTGIADPGEVTIAKGYTYRKHYGWEDIDEEVDVDTDSDSSSRSGVRVPDTGVFGGDSNGVMIAAISVGAVITMAVGTAVVYWLLRRYNGNIKFQSK